MRTILNVFVRCQFTAFGQGSDVQSRSQARSAKKPGFEQMPVLSPGSPNRRGTSGEGIRTNSDTRHHIRYGRSR